MQESWILVFHLVGMVFWLGTLLLITRILAWHVDQEESMKAKLVELERKLMMGGAIPGALITIITGLWMLIELEWGPLDAATFGAGFHIKLTLIVLLVALHALIKIKAGALARGESTSAKSFKALHGVCGLLLIAIIATVVVVYPKMKRKKAEQRSKEVTSQVAPQEQTPSRSPYEVSGL